MFSVGDRMCLSHAAYGDCESLGCKRCTYILQDCSLQNSPAHPSTWCGQLRQNLVCMTANKNRNTQTEYQIRTGLHIYIYIYTHTHTHIHRVSQEEYARLRENVPYVKVHRYNPKHLYPKLNGYGDNGERSLKV